MGKFALIEDEISECFSVDGCAVSLASAIVHSYGYNQNMLKEDDEKCYAAGFLYTRYAHI
jgi:hypothetical protein